MLFVSYVVCFKPCRAFGSNLYRFGWEQSSTRVHSAHRLSVWLSLRWRNRGLPKRRTHRHSSKHSRHRNRTVSYDFNFNSFYPDNLSLFQSTSSFGWDLRGISITFKRQGLKHKLRKTEVTIHFKNEIEIEFNQQMFRRIPWKSRKNFTIKGFK